MHSRLQGELLRALNIYEYWAGALELSDGEMAQLAVAGDLAGVRRIFAASTARVRRAERVHNAWRVTPLVPKLRDFVERKRVDALKALKSASSELARDVRRALMAADEGHAQIISEALLSRAGLAKAGISARALLSGAIEQAFQICILEGHAACVEVFLDAALAREYCWPAFDADGLEARRVQMTSVSAVFGHVEVLDMLRRRGVSLRGALTSATMHGQVDSCIALLQDVAVLQELRQGDSAAITAAVMYARPGALNVLLSAEGVALDSDPVSSSAFMMLAARENSRDIIEVLLDHGLSVDSRHPGPSRAAGLVTLTALGIAADRNYYDLAVYLLSRGASVCNDAAPFSAFRSCVNAMNKEYVLNPEYRVDMVRLLVNARPDECTFDDRDGCADVVLNATITDNIDLLRFLLTKTSASPNARTENGSTALHWAIINPDTSLEFKLKIVGLLIDYGAELHDAARTTEGPGLPGLPAGVTPYEALEYYAPLAQRAKLKEFVDARVALREPRREA